MDLTLYIILLIVFAVIAVLSGWIPWIGFLELIILVILGLIFAWDPSLILIICVILIIVNFIAMILSILAALPTAGLSLIGAALPQLIMILACMGVGSIAFFLMILELFGILVATEALIGSLLIDGITILGLGIAVKKVKGQPRTCITINDTELCFGKED